VSIHSTAIVDSTARLGNDVEIGPFSVIEHDVEIGDGCRIDAHAVIKSGTKLGAENRVDVGVVLGGRPQHRGIRDGQQVGKLVIGDRNCIREHATIHVGMSSGQATILGDDNLIMVSVHIGHDCVIGNENVLANNVMLAGHVTIGDRTNMSGAAAVHQYCRVGSLAMVGGQARVTQDVPPFVTVDGASTCLVGLNSIGLRRAGFPTTDLRVLKEAYRLAFRSGLPFEEKIQQLRLHYPQEPTKTLWTFMSSGQRGFLQDRRGPAPRNEMRLRVVHPPDDSLEVSRRRQAA
jgi:UDP-N-acetylglucosamine acyltransferase